MLLIIIYVIICAFPLLILVTPRFLHGVILLAFGILTPMVLLETALRLGYRSADLNWTPPEAIVADDLLNVEHGEYSQKHPYGFNDPIVSPYKAPGMFRIVVLGDSIIWGDGVRRNERWSEKLEQKINAQHKDIQVLHWGLRGWSTQDQVKFLRENAAAWQIDYLLISYISNDPDIKLVPQKHVMWNTFTFPVHLAKIFPYAARFIFGYLSQLINERIPGWGYDYWERQLYSPDNLKEYAKTVYDLKNVMAELKVPATVIFVPSSWLSYFKEQFDKVLPIFRENNIQVLDLYPEVYQQVSSLPLAELRANRADGHPGPIMTEAYASIVFRHLKDTYRNASNRDLPLS